MAITSNTLTQIDNATNKLLQYTSDGTGTDLGVIYDDSASTYPLLATKRLMSIKGCISTNGRGSISLVSDGTIPILGLGLSTTSSRVFGNRAFIDYDFSSIGGIPWATATEDLVLSGPVSAAFYDSFLAVRIKN